MIHQATKPRTPRFTTLYSSCRYIATDLALTATGEMRIDRVIRHSAPLRRTRLVRESSWSPGTETTPDVSGAPVRSAVRRFMVCSAASPQAEHAAVTRALSTPESV